MDNKIYSDCWSSGELSINIENWLCDANIKLHNLTPEQIVDEAKYVLSTFFESGHSNNDILNCEFPEDRKYAKKEVKALKTFIKKYDKGE
jgi:hypothetical protein